MSWLLAELWAVLLGAFGLGAAFGWLLRSGLAVARTRAHRDDQARLSAQQAELQRLREGLAAREAAPSAPAASQAPSAPVPQAAAADLDLRLAEAMARIGAQQAEIAALRAQLEAPAPAVPPVPVEVEQALSSARQWQHTAQTEWDTLQTRFGQLQAREAELQACVAGLRVQLDALRRVEPVPEVSAASAVPVAVAEAAVAAPAGPVTADDLRRIRGVGPKLEALLHGLGIRWYEQIARADVAELERIAAALPGFAQRVRREDWPGQCRQLYREKYGRLP